MKSKMIIAVGTLLAVLGCKPNYQEKLAAVSTEKIPVVKVVELTPSSAPIPLQASGVLTSKARVMRSFKLGGIVQELLVEEGQSFRKGDVLARLERTEIDARVQQAREQVDKLQRDRERVQRLYNDTVATLEQLQDISTALEVAEADLQIATYNQSYATIVALENGKVLKRMAERGELVNAGTPILQIARQGTNSNYIVRIGVADRDVVKLQTGDSAKVHLDAFPNEQFRAEVTEIAEAADPMTGTFEIELTLAPTPYRLRNGFIAKMDIYPSLQAPYYRVPITALVAGDGEQATVYVPDGKTVREVKVRPALIADEYFVVEAQAGTTLDRVIADGAAYAKPGEPVEFLNL